MRHLQWLTCFLVSQGSGVDKLCHSERRFVRLCGRTAVEEPLSAKDAAKSPSRVGIPLLLASLVARDDKNNGPNFKVRISSVRFASFPAFYCSIPCFPLCSKHKKPCARSRWVTPWPDHRARFSYDDLRRLLTCGFAAPSSRHKGSKLRSAYDTFFVPVRAVLHTTRLRTGYAKLEFLSVTQRTGLRFPLRLHFWHVERKAVSRTHQS